MSDQTFNIPNSLIEALKAGEVIPFIGAGVSLSVKKNNAQNIKTHESLFPSWKQFLFNAAAKLDTERIAVNDEGKSKKAIVMRSLLDDDPVDYLDIAQRAFTSLGENYWYELLIENFDIDVDSADQESLELPKLIWQLSNNLVVTTNVDLVLQSVHETSGKVKTLDTQVAEFAELQKGWRPARPTVLHLHGHINDKVNVVFTKEQYEEFYDLNKNRAKLETLRSLFTQRTILFIGFSLDDLFILKELEKVNVIYEGRASNLFVLIHEEEKDNSNIPPYIQKITFSNFGKPLIEKIHEILRLAAKDTREVSSLTIESSENAIKNHFNVPFASKGKTYVGREGLTEKIWESLDKGGRAAIGQAVNIRGIGGLGKTQLAVEYAYEFRARYENGVFWLTADKDIDTQLIKIGKDLRWISSESDSGFNLTELVRNRFRKLSDCLIIFDNVDDRSAIEEYLPEKDAHPHLLITSREKQSGFHQIELDLLKRDEARNLLLSIAGREPQTPVGKKALEGILMELEDLPLAVELVGGYLGEKPLFTFEKYYLFLLGEPLDKLESAFPEDSFTKHDKSIIRTLRISEKLLQKPLMREVLDTLAWSGKSFMGFSLLHALVGINDEFALLNVLSDALNLRLIKKDENSERYSIHRLLARVRQIENPLTDQKEWHRNIVKHMEDWFRTKNEELKTFSDAENEIDHLKAWQKRTFDHLPSEAVWLTMLQANPLMVRGNYREAQEYVEEAFELYNRENLTDNLLLANLYNAISQPSIYLGNSGEAKIYIEKALNFYNTKIIDDKKLLAELLSNLGTVYGDLDDYEKALDLQEQALEIQMELFGGKNHPFIATALSKTGYAYGEMGNHQKALELKQQALEMWQELFGDKHSEIATSLNNLGLTYSHLGDHEKALEFKRKALEMREDLFRQKHPYIANSLSNLGSTYIQLGKYEEGFELKEQALEMRQELFGASHSYTIKTCRNLIELYKKLGYTEKANVLAAKFLGFVPTNHPYRKFFEENSSEFWKDKGTHRKRRRLDS